MQPDILPVHMGASEALAASRVHAMICHASLDGTEVLAYLAAASLAR